MLKSKTFWGALIAFIPALWTFITVALPELKVISSEEASDVASGVVTSIGALIVVIRKVQAVYSAVEPDETKENK